MMDATALAYVNMYGVLGALENLCALDGDARAVLCEKAAEKGIDARCAPPVFMSGCAAAVCALAEEEYESAMDRSVYTAAALTPVYLRPGRVGDAPLQ